MDQLPSNVAGLYKQLCKITTRLDEHIWIKVHIALIIDQYVFFLLLEIMEK
jgi:hypothetical protein